MTLKQFSTEDLKEIHWSLDEVLENESLVYDLELSLYEHKEKVNFYYTWAESRITVLGWNSSPPFHKNNKYIRISYLAHHKLAANWNQPRTDYFTNKRL